MRQGRGRGGLSKYSWMAAERPIGLSREADYAPTVQGRQQREVVDRMQTASGLVRGGSLLWATVMYLI